MKFLFAIIPFILFCENANAQFADTIKYVWQNETTKINASIEIYNAENTKSKGCIYFITHSDTSFKSISDSLFNKFIASSSQLNIVKISFYNLYDTNKLSLFSTELINFILPDLAKKYKQLSNSTLILAGINDYALVALHAAMYNSEKINSTALFFNEYKPETAFSKELKSSPKQLKGKLFMYVNGGEENSLLTDSLAENLALNSSIILYKYDDENVQASKNIFTEAYNWLIADGNNYVLKTDD